MCRLSKCEFPLISALSYSASNSHSSARPTFHRMHETGHNLDMTHSGTFVVEGTFDEYADTSCYMGYSVDDGGNDQNDEQKCFNAAKMVELGWYSNAINSIQPGNTISPGNNEEFNGNVIGVADYDIAVNSYTLSLEIKYPLKGVNSYFLTYNKAKGINEDTHSGPNEVRIVQGAPGEQSSLIASISPGSSSVSIPDYYNGRSLDITVGTEGVDAGVNFVPVLVSQETITCTVDNDCIGNISTCNTSTCTAGGTCEYSLIPDCCGNGICETSSGEYCNNCPTDCVSPTDCDELDGRSDYYFGGSSSSAAYGIKFNVDVASEISFYEIEADLSLGVTERANISFPSLPLPQPTVLVILCVQK